MFTLKPPILWYDTTRICQRDATKLIAAYEHRGVVVIPVYGDGVSAIGTCTPERYPTPDELFYWTPKAPVGAIRRVS